MNLTLDTLPDWMDQAACANAANADFFFPNHGDRDTKRRAKAFCAGCPVRAKCLAWALDHERARHHMHGVYGGLGVAERRQLLKEKA